MKDSHSGVEGEGRTSKINRDDVIFFIMSGIIICAMIYLLLGYNGWLPEIFYDICDPDKHTIEERVKMGCCEDISEPELFFGVTHACNNSLRQDPN